MSETIDKEKLGGMCTHGNFVSSCGDCKVEKSTESNRPSFRDFTDHQVIEEIFVDGSKEELEGLRAHYDLTSEQMDGGKQSEIRRRRIS